jgi:hypothetical protein
MIKYFGSNNNFEVYEIVEGGEKIKKIEESANFSNRINFVDSNNLVVGYDFEGESSEDFYVKISNGYEKETFTGAFEQCTSRDKNGYVTNSIKFFITNGGVLELFNHHNGYYFKNFEFIKMTDIGEKEIKRGRL